MVDESGTVTWTWTNPTVSPLTFSYTVDVPAGETGEHAILASATVQSDTTAQIDPRPASLVVRRLQFHDADTNRDLQLGLTELLRVIELYNTRHGTVRTGAYGVDPGNHEDGFTADPARLPAAATPLSRYHSGDSNRDGAFSLTELLRLIELYNTRRGTLRTGEYHVDQDTEDGFAAGPGAGE